MGKLGENIHGGVVDDEEIGRVREALLFEDPERKRKVTRFFYLLIFATAIATFGLLADSVATVIGAMIVAPLMLPIMGVAFGVSLGDRKIILSSLTHIDFGHRYRNCTRLPAHMDNSFPDQRRRRTLR